MPFSDKHMELLNAVKDSGAIDFDKMGQVATEITPQLFDPQVAAGDYIASGYSSVVKVWKQMEDIQGIEQIAQLQQMLGNVSGPGPTG